MKRYIHTADAVFAIVLFCAFTVSILMVLMMGARAYQDIRDTVSKHNSENTCVSYITTKLRHFDTDGRVALGDIDGTPALLLTQTIEGQDYTTWVYFYDGYVKELFAEAAYDAAPAEGLEVIDAAGLAFESPQPGLIHIVCTGSDGTAADTYVSTRSWGAAG